MPYHQEAREVNAHDSSVRLLTGTVILIVCFLNSICSLAQAQVVESRPTVTRATDLVFEYPGRVPLGTEVVFKRRTSAAAGDVVNAGVQVRVFSLNEDETRPMRIDTIGDCEVYLSVVHRLESTADGGLRFAKMNQGWINLTNSENSTKDARWFLVFEQIGAPQMQFRIKAADASQYFGTGFAVTVYDNSSIPFELIKAEHEKRRAEAARLYKEVVNKDPSVRCYSYKRLRASIKTEDLIAYGDSENCTTLSGNTDLM